MPKPVNYPDLAGKVAIVTGGCKGIGRAISEALLANGVMVIATYHQDVVTAEAFAKSQSSDSLLVVQSDVANLGQHETLLQLSRHHWQKPPSLLVNNAGVLRQQPFYEISPEDWDWIMDSNLKGLFFLSQAFLAQAEHASVVNLSSVGGQIGGDKAPHYAASKAAIISLSRSLARIGSHKATRVNCVAPGWIETPIFTPEQLHNLQTQAKQQLPLGRLGQPHEVAAAVLFLLSQAASFITGHCLNINGGQYFG